MKKSSSVSKCFLLLAVGASQYASHSMASFMRQPCDLKVDGRGSVTFRSDLLRESGDPIDPDGQLRPGFFYFHEREKALEYGNKICAKTEEAFKQRLGDGDGEFHCTVELRSTAPEPDAQFFVMSLFSSFAHKEQDPNEIFTYSATASSTVRRAKMAAQEVARAMVRKVERCIQKETNPDQLKRLSQQKEDLERLISHPDEIQPGLTD